MFGECEAAQSLRRIVGETNSAVAEKFGEAVPTLQHVIDGLGDW